MSLSAIPTDDHAVLYGAGFFETFRTCDGAPVRLAAHLARLRAACEKIGIRIPDTLLAAHDDPDRWAAALAPRLAAAGLRDGVARYTLTAGPRPGPLDDADYRFPSEFLIVRPAPPAAPPGGISLHLLNTVRDTGEWRPRPKSVNYLNSLLASRELAPRRRHPADEGVMLDAAGHIAEGVFSNLIWRRAGAWETPHEDTGCLPGVGRALLLDALRARGEPVVETTAPVDALREADAVACVSAVRGVTPVARLVSPAGETLARYAPPAGLPAHLFD